jgi:hypothetical protein
LAATSLVAGYGRSFVEATLVLKCRFAFTAIAPRYRCAIRGGYRTDWVSAFPHAQLLRLDGSAPG